MEVIVPILIIAGGYFIWRYVKREYLRYRMKSAMVDGEPAMMSLSRAMMRRDWYANAPGVRFEAARELLTNPRAAYAAFRGGGGELSERQFLEIMHDLIADDPACTGLR